MRLGLSSWALPHAVASGALNALGLIDCAAAWGLRLVQLADNLALPEPAAVAARARARGVDLSLGVRGSDEATLRAGLATAGLLGARLLRLLLDRGDDRPGHDEAVRRLRAVLPAARAAGVVLAVENHDRLPAAGLAAIVCAAGEGCGVCLDTVNSLGCGEGVRETVAALAPLAVDLHLKDYRIRRAADGLGFHIEGAPAGEGMLDLPWLLGELRRHGRDPDAILEQWVPAGADERAWAERSLARLRPIILS